MHTLIVSNPAHFHAGLALRNRHPLLRDEVFVYAQDGPDLERFLALVETFNTRPEAPTGWRLQIYRGADHLDQLIAQRKGDVVLIAGKNDSKMATIHRLQGAGFAVLCDKTWLIDGAHLPLVEQVVASAPLALDMMTERHDVGHRVLNALIRAPAVFGDFRREDDEPGLRLWSVHHLYKQVNGRPLRRPDWYFDTTVQGEGIMDVTTHLADLALWLTDRGQSVEADREMVLRAAWQWPTEVPLSVYRNVTGMDHFPAAARHAVRGDSLAYLCNARIDFSVRGVPVVLEEMWGLEEPAGGSDAFRTTARGSLATLELIHDDSTGFATELMVTPNQISPNFPEQIDAALLACAPELPGLSVAAHGDRYRVLIPPAILTTHEQHFAKVLDEFLRLVDAGARAEVRRADLRAKYTLLARARGASRQGRPG